MRGGMVPIPAGQEPGVDVQTATAGDRAIAGLGQDVAQVGGFLVQAEAYKAQKTRAQDVLDSTLAFQPYTRALEQGTADLAVNGDYRTLPDDVEKLGTDLLHQYAEGHKLSAQGKAMFRLKAEEAITMARHNALGVQTHRREQERSMAMATEVQQTQDDYARAETEADRMMILGRLQGTLTQGVAAGLWHGTEAAKIYRGTEQAVKKDRAMLANRAHPMESFNELTDWATALTEGKPFVPQTDAFKGLSPEQLPPLIDDARVQMHQQTTLSLQQDHLRQRQDEARQEHTAVELRHDLVTLLPTIANLPALEQQFQKINEAGPRKDISATAHAQLLNLAQAYLDTARKPPTVQDDPATERQIALEFLQSSTPGDMDGLRTHLATATVNGLLKPETVKGYATGIESRENTLHYSNRAAYKTGRQLIADAAVPGATMPGLQQFMDEKVKNRLRDTLEAYEARMAGFSPRDVDAQATTIARQLIKDFLSDPVDTIDRLPLPLQVKNSQNQLTLSPRNAWMTIDKLPLAKAQKLQMHQGFMDFWQAYPTLFEPHIRGEWEHGPGGIGVTGRPSAMPLPVPGRPSPSGTPGPPGPPVTPVTPVPPTTPRPAQRPGVSGGSQYKGAE